MRCVVRNCYYIYDRLKDLCTYFTVHMRSRSIQAIYVVSLFYICPIQNTDDIIQTHISIWWPRVGSSKRLVKGLFQGGSVIWFTL